MPVVSHESIQTQCLPFDCSDALDTFSRISESFDRFPGHCPALSECNCCCCNCSGFGRLMGVDDSDGSQARTGDTRGATIGEIEGAETNLLLNMLNFRRFFF